MSILGRKKYLHPDTSESAAILNEMNRSRSLHLVREAI